MYLFSRDWFLLIFQSRFLYLVLFNSYSLRFILSFLRGLIFWLTMFRLFNCLFFSFNFGFNNHIEFFWYLTLTIFFFYWCFWLLSTQSQLSFFTFCCHLFLFNSWFWNLLRVFNKTKLFLVSGNQIIVTFFYGLHIFSWF